MSERKYNTNNNMNENGEKVRSVESNTRPVWRRYAAIAATFVLLAGGIGGTIALGKHVNNNKRSDNKLAAAAVEITTTAPETTTAAMTTTVTTTTTQVVTDATIAEIVTSAAETETSAAETTAATEAATVTADDRRDPSDLAAFAEEWKDKYEEYIWKINCGAVEHEESVVSFKLAEGSVPAVLEAWKVTDEKLHSAESINRFVYSVWAPGTNDDVAIPDLTDKIDSGKAEYTDVNSLLFVYNNELYRVASNTGLEGERFDLSAEKLNDNEMLVHWTLGYEGAGEEQSLHLVWVAEYNDWRIDDLVSGSKYFGKPIQGEAEAVAKEMLSGYKDVYNAKYGIGVEYDENDQINFAMHSNNPSDGEWFVYYAKVTDSRFANTDDLKAYFDTKYTDKSSELYNVIGGDLSKYPTGYSFNLDAEYKEYTDNAYMNLTNYIMYNGSLYVRYDCFHTHFWGAQNVCEYYKMQNDPEITAVRVANGNMIVVKTNDDTVEYENDCREYTIFRDDSGEWRIYSTATCSK
ncbi:hypothetical protein [uncultured Ruminococcus sp.]|uniref:hypothetical protein n=1 Tax=uncultured Ruminococcus sp. TaxID=165186 RepID=UPI00260DADA0|nr:hypothetical protein [uncultured Ruminococcus sp.]